MTAEIAIMNKEGIAIAADSAVTMTVRDEQKIFTSANKLFSLSNHSPVGIMVYGNAIFMGVPWETIIKIYRSMLEKKKFDTLKEYADNFIAFLDKGNKLFPDSVQEKYLKSSVYGYFAYVRKEINDKVYLKIAEEKKITDETTEQIISEIIKKHYEDWEKTDNIPSIPKSYNEEVVNKYSEIIDKAIKEVFEKLPISKSHINQLKKIVSYLFSKFPEGVQKGDISGVVIAGFGEKEIFPSLVSFIIDGVVNNRLKYKTHITQKINFEIDASVVPFAQSEMVHTFMEGINPNFQNKMDGYLSEIFDKYPEIIVRSITKYDDNEKNQLKEEMKQESNKIFKSYQEHMQIVRRQDNVDPIIKVVSMLPKDELAAMAESLVNLTSFKRKVTMEMETVGGPIDVAIISKGDGFVWIKRKHYFSPELNPQFLSKYYK
ncbi:MAG: hypothetical protein CVT88_08715 [Candidatus Altiarchaeales archaeon HGW-Altiarchaeales-1]|nr:MAG: hypothetical protein CVT89_04950 [Candidatus Altiarchaeales archaeon HGW-Altiarchaeales-2]PKP57571.1 MAG: hypothetical protein CVT88_08715 [Candidatus Altiarchaeales archaeon HGW-Altiarchaeales-1]